MLRDIWLIFRRTMSISLRNPAWVMIGVLQPLLYLVLFGPLMERIVESTPGFPPGNSWTILTPALVIQLALFGSAFAGFGLLAEFRAGVLERLRVTPVSRLALLLGKVLHEAVHAIVQAALLITLAFLFFDLNAPFGGVLLSMVIVALFAITLASASYAVALSIKSEETFPQLLNSFTLPSLLLSGILIPITTQLAPDWLYKLSLINPFRYIVDAERAAFRGDMTMDALFTGCVVLAVLTVLSVTWGARTFQRENA
ncbi:ABC-2 type transport system permease protein [Tamaricihabitans halophyticus]|uniref:Transport permease protein n=1 Tax=Tamaricihabitans halophyticus TaxID=1262583 RepID=A0A4V2SUY9_9PSEU|nr:ABC transporter permease [Tamaricihabitans halophyticus]TCP56386.1 ABC-2 type transport system permease protein [Tamaricihabitans halophyticus]